MKTAERNSVANFRSFQPTTPYAGFPANAVAVRQVLPATIGLYNQSGCKTAVLLTKCQMLEREVNSNA